MKRYPAIFSTLYNTPHLMTREKYAEISAFMRAVAVGDRRRDRPSTVHWEHTPPYCVTAGGERVAMDKIEAGGPAQQDFVAVLPLFGTLWQHGGIEMDASGGTSLTRWMADLRRLAANQAVRSIVINAHTPGGQVWGTQEASDLVWEIRNGGGPRLVTVVNSQMASGGVWIGTAAERVAITPGGEAGSIGVVYEHVDTTGADEQAGIKSTLLAFPAEKMLGWSGPPLSDEGRAMIEARIQDTYARFVAAVARNRGVSKSKVQKDFGGGRMLAAKDAVAAGLADEVATLDAVVAGELKRLERSGRRSRRNQVALAKAVAETA